MPTGHPLPPPCIWHNLAVPKMLTMTTKPKTLSRRCIAPGRGTAVRHTKDPGRVSQAPPWARASAGARNYTLYYGTTFVQASVVPFKVGQRWPFFLPRVMRNKTVQNFLQSLVLFRNEKAQGSADFFARQGLQCLFSVRISTGLCRICWRCPFQRG